MTHYIFKGVLSILLFPLFLFTANMLSILINSMTGILNELFYVFALQVGFSTFLYWLLGLKSKKYIIFFNLIFFLAWTFAFTPSFYPVGHKFQDEPTYVPTFFSFILTILIVILIIILDKKTPNKTVFDSKLNRKYGNVKNIFIGLLLLAFTFLLNVIIFYWGVVSYLNYFEKKEERFVRQVTKEFEIESLSLNLCYEKKCFYKVVSNKCDKTIILSKGPGLYNGSSTRN